MGNFNRGGDRDGRGGDLPAGRQGGGGFRPRREVTMHKATCSNCGQSCEVPFRPTGDKPVYCNNCFGKMRDAGGGGGRDDRGPRRDFGGAPRQNFDSNRGNGNADIVKQLEIVNSKLDKLIRALERPVTVPEPKPVFAGTLKQAVKKATDSKKKK